MCLSQLPPEPIKPTFEDLVNTAKFHLSLEKKVLLHDPIWDTYSDEDILVEWYAIVASKDEKFCQDLLFRLGTGYADDRDFLDKLVEENQKHIINNNEVLDSTEEFEFTPNDVMGSRKIDGK